jgi:hypothetical protein
MRREQLLGLMLGLMLGLLQELLDQRLKAGHRGRLFFQLRLHIGDQFVLLAFALCWCIRRQAGVRTALLAGCVW